MKQFFFSGMALGGLLFASNVAQAQSEAESSPVEPEAGIEINLEALERLENPADASPTPAEDDGPPALTPAPLPVQDQPEPQSPAAPESDTVSLEPTPPADAEAYDGRVVALLFDEASDTLTLSAAERLDALAAEVEDDPLRLQLFAYAGTDEQSPSATRRLALQRAIAVRGYLMDKGVDGTRIDLRPQGPATDGTAPERVDVIFVVQ